MQASKRHELLRYHLLLFNNDANHAERETDVARACGCNKGTRRLQTVYQRCKITPWRLWLKRLLFKLKVAGFRCARRFSGAPACPAP